jgi:hypothetical protein
MPIGYASRFSFLSPLVGSYLVVCGTTRYIRQNTTGTNGSRRVVSCAPGLLPVGVMLRQQLERPTASGQLPTDSNGRAPTLLQRQRSTLYLLRYCESSTFRTSLSIVRFRLDRHLPAGVTSRQQVETDCVKSTAGLIEMGLNYRSPTVAKLPSPKRSTMIRSGCLDNDHERLWCPCAPPFFLRPVKNRIDKDKDQNFSFSI